MWDFDGHDVTTFLIGCIVGLVVAVVWMAIII